MTQSDSARIYQYYLKKNFPHHHLSSSVGEKEGEEARLNGEAML